MTARRPSWPTRAKRWILILFAAMSACAVTQAEITMVAERADLARNRCASLGGDWCSGASACQDAALLLIEQPTPTALAAALAVCPGD